MREWEGMELNILLGEGMGMFIFNTMGMGWEWEYGHGNGIEKVIPTYLLFTYWTLFFHKSLTL